MKKFKNPYFVWKNEALKTIDQRLIPYKEKYIELKNIKQYYDAIAQLKVRGAPAIGITACFAILSLIRNENNIEKCKRKIIVGIKYLKTSRPTAVNMFNYLEIIEKRILSKKYKNIQEMKKDIKKIVFDIMEKEIYTCEKIAFFGKQLIKNKMNILTHCNTGMLATYGIGTALGIVFESKEKKPHIFVPETRPLLQGGRLTVFELKKQNVNHTLITDNMRGYLFSKGLVDIVIVGADRIALNGDTANKIGTLESAVLAYNYNVPFYIAAPSSTFDSKCKQGSSIKIEMRNKEEVLKIKNIKIVFAEKVLNPSFDITPSKYITGIITEKGIVKPNLKCIKEMLLS